MSVYLETHKESDESSKKKDVNSGNIRLILEKEGVLKNFEQFLAIPDDSTKVSLTNNFMFLLKAAVAIFINDSKNIAKYYNADLLTFLSTLLIQKQISSSRVFPILLESYAKIFIKWILKQEKPEVTPDMKDQSEMYTVLQNFNREKINISAQKDSKHPPLHNIICFYKLVTTFARLWKTPDFAEFFFKKGSDNLQYISDMLPEAFFCAYVDLLTSLCCTPELTYEVVKHVQNSSSDVLSFQNFINAINGHSLDLATVEVERKKLSMVDSQGMESVLHFLAAICHNGMLHKVVPDEKDLEHIIVSLFEIILSAVPATLKGACFDLISQIPYNDVLATYCWRQLRASNILCQEYIDTNNGGLVSELDKIERPFGQYNLLRSFIRCLSSFLEFSAPEEGFNVYHNFLFNNVLIVFGQFTYSQDVEKWDLLRDLSQCWTNLINLGQKEVAQPLFETALGDQRFIKTFLTSILVDDCPLEAHLSVFHLLYLLAVRERDMSSSMSSYTTVYDQISWNQEAVFLLLKCTACINRELQLTSIHLLHFLAIKSPKVIQVSLSKPTAHAIEIIKYVLENDENEGENQSVDANVRCSMMNFLLDLSPDSYFLRYICGFDLHDPPFSIINSTLSGGILITLLNSLQNHDTHIYSPIFTSQCLKLFLLLCENNVTISPLLNLLLSTKHSFFRDILALTRDGRCLGSTVGCYMQLLAREAAKNEDAIFSGSSVQVFEMILSSHGGSENSIRNILILEFIDRIRDDEESRSIAEGLKEIAVTFFNNAHAKEMMGTNPSIWTLNWLMCAQTLLEHIQTLRDKELVRVLSETASAISYQLFVRKVFGQIDRDSVLKIFRIALRSVIHLSSFEFTQTRVALYSIIQSALNSLKSHQNECQKVFEPMESDIFHILRTDVDDPTPILEVSALSVAESLICIASPEMYKLFILTTVGQIEGDWNLFRANKVDGSIVLMTKCSLYTAILSQITETSVLHLFVEEGVCYKLSDGDFWNRVSSNYSECASSEEAELELRMGAKVLRCFTALATVFSRSEDARRHVTYFLSKFNNSLTNVLNYGGKTTVVGHVFLADLLELVAVVPGFERANNSLITHVISTFAKFSTASSAGQSDVVAKILNSCVVFLAKRADYTQIFNPPLFGEEWNPKKTNDSAPPLSVVTKYAIEILKEEGGKAEMRKTIASMCLLIIWRHIDRWSSEKVNFNVGSIRAQAKIFNELPFSKKDANLDSVILQKLSDFASDK